MIPERVETERLVLTKPATKDVAAFLQLFTNPDVMATLGGLRSPADTQAFIDRMYGHWAAHNFGLWAVYDRQTGAFIGRGGLRMVLLESGPEVEMGYVLLPEFWGRGIATEIATTSLQVGFRDLPLKSIVAFTLPTNQASRRVMEKVGMSYERDGTFLGIPHVFYRNQRPQ